MSDEKCARCGEEGEDRRTLWMACFYAMEELEVPFENQTLFHADLKELELAKPPLKFESKISKTPIVLQSGTVRSSGELHPERMYTLRVCKECRADWLGAIQAWFKAPKSQSQGTGTGVYVRENGAVREATPEQVEELIRKRGG